MDIKVVSRKKTYIVLPAPTAKISLESRLPHPTNGTSIYGVLPPIFKARSQLFEGGDIVLRYGRHAGDRYSKNGFGFRHIWIRRFHTITEEPLAMTAVQELVASIIRPGASIFWEMGTKAAVFCNRNGEVIVEERGTPGSHFYSVVTAIKPPVHPHGALISVL